MSARAMLREAAADYDQRAKDMERFPHREAAHRARAAALRALAARIDEEEARVARLKEIGGGMSPSSSVADALLARLDAFLAPPAATPPPADYTCDCGTPALPPDQHSFHCRVNPRSNFPAPRNPEKPCECGGFRFTHDELGKRPCRSCTPGAKP